jgi:hypothetical protein
MNDRIGEAIEALLFMLTLGVLLMLVAVSRNWPGGWRLCAALLTIAFFVDLALGVKLSEMETPEQRRAFKRSVFFLEIAIVTMLFYFVLSLLRVFQIGG